MRPTLNKLKSIANKVTSRGPTGFFVPWDYPEPIEDGQVLRFYADERFINLMYMAKHGWHTAQRAAVHMSIIHPRYDFKPTIDDEYRENFETLLYERKTPELVLYEHEGKLIMSRDYEAYWLYRELEIDMPSCIIVGKFTEVGDICTYDRPFLIGDRSSKVLFGDTSL
ncbi:MAG: hypothetical protein QG623_526 [Patescibacteria group bacterium]|jgi:hypothetical protein|nr:hypothetical protein [Patescibacteria group bacterium]